MPDNVDIASICRHAEPKRPEPSKARLRLVVLQASDNDTLLSNIDRPVRIPRGLMV